MRISSSHNHYERGNILAITMIITVLLGIVLASYLTMVGSQNKMTARSQTWNTCVGIAEAGIEDALTHLNINGTTNFNLACAGWTLSNGLHSVSRNLGAGYYSVTIDYGIKPVITSTGYLPAPLNVVSTPGPFLAAAGNQVSSSAGVQYISRTLRVVCRGNGSLSKAIVARDKVLLNGKNVTVDSYDSYSPSASTYTNGGSYGIYDPAKISDHGDVAVIGGLSDTLKIGKSTVYGRVSTGPDGDIRLDKNAVVGSLAWVNGGNIGVQPGYASSDANFDMPPVVAPFAAAPKPIGGLVGTNYYDVILPAGDWQLGNFKGLVYVSGGARLLVTGNITFDDSATTDEGIEFAAGASLKVYMKGQTARFVGRKTKKKVITTQTCFNEGGNATNFLYYGLNNNTEINLSKMDEFTGIIYAPNANIKLKAGSPKYYRCHVFGALSGYQVTLEKNAHMHYDENISTADNTKNYVIESYQEL